MDITLLPEEIFVNIAKYLSADDLLLCSLVNFSWRNAVNCNEIWHQVCKTSIVSETGEELDSAPSLVCDQSYPYSAANFDPLCKWRKTFMRWSKLKYNWSKGKYKRFKIDEVFSNFCSIECENNNLVLVYDDLREVSVWNIENIPFYQESVRFSLTHVRSEFVKLCNDYLVIVQCNLLQVFHYTDGSFRLMYRSIFDEDETVAQTLPNDSNITQWYCSNINLYPCDLTLRCEHNGDKFVGVNLKDDYKNTVLHVWNLNEMKKTVVLLPQSSEIVLDINFSVSDNNLYLMIKRLHPIWEVCDAIYIYDLKFCRFIEFESGLSINYSVPAFMFHNNLVLAVDKFWKFVNIWDIREKFLKKIDCDYTIEIKCLNIVSSYLIIGGKCSPQNSQRTINVFNLSNFKCIFTTTVSHSVDYVSLIQHTFLIIGGFGSNRFISVTDILKKCCLYVIADDDCMFVNSIQSKMLTRIDNELNLITFW